MFHFELSALFVALMVAPSLFLPIVVDRHGMDVFSRELQPEDGDQLLPRAGYSKETQDQLGTKLATDGKRANIGLHAFLAQDWGQSEDHVKQVHNLVIEGKPDDAFDLVRTRHAEIKAGEWQSKAGARGTGSYVGGQQGSSSSEQQFPPPFFSPPLPLDALPPPPATPPQSLGLQPSRPELQVPTITPGGHGDEEWGPTPERGIASLVPQAPETHEDIRTPSSSRRASGKPSRRSRPSALHPPPLPSPPAPSASTSSSLGHALPGPPPPPTSKKRRTKKKPWNKRVPVVPRATFREIRPAPNGKLLRDAQYISVYPLPFDFQNFRGHPGNPPEPRVPEQTG